jgi:hypothetical protein
MYRVQKNNNNNNNNHNNNNNNKIYTTYEIAFIIINMYIHMGV